MLGIGFWIVDYVCMWVFGDFDVLLLGDVVFCVGVVVVGFFVEVKLFIVWVECMVLWCSYLSVYFWCVVLVCLVGFW